MTTQIIEGQIGDLYSKERNLLPRVCHLQIKGIQLQIPIKSPKSFIISICLHKNKSTLKTTSPVIITPDNTSIQLNIKFIFSYLHYFKDTSLNKLLIRLHKLKKPNIVYATGTVYLTPIFYSGFDGELTIKGSLEKKNFNKDLFLLNCNIETIPLEYNHVEDLDLFKEICTMENIDKDRNIPENLDIFFENVENMQMDSSDSEETLSLSQLQQDEKKQQSLKLNMKIQSKNGELKSVGKEQSKEMLRDSKRKPRIDSPRKSRQHKLRESKEYKDMKEARESKERFGNLSKEQATSCAQTSNDIIDDSTETQDHIKSFETTEDKINTIDQNEESIVFVLDIEKRRSIRFYEAFGLNVDHVVNKHIHFLFVRHTDEMKKMFNLLFQKVSTREKKLTICICGSDSYTSLFVRNFIETLPKKLLGIEMMQLVCIPMGKTCEYLKLLDTSHKYKQYFVNEEWRMKFDRIDPIPLIESTEIVENIEEYISNAITPKQLQLGEIQFTTTTDETISLPFLKSICLMAQPCESKHPSITIDICKQKKDKFHNTKIKKNVSTLDVIKINSTDQSKTPEKFIDPNNVLFTVLRKNDKTLLSCEQIVALYCTDDDDKKKKKKDEKKEESPMKKDEKEDGANVFICSKTMITCEDSFFYVFIDGRKYCKEVKYISIKNSWTGQSSISLNVIN